MSYLIAITGGIGAGKSVVCRMLTTLGYDVYDCDSRAKSLIDGDRHIKRRIAEEVCMEALSPDGKIDRRRLGSHVFNNPKSLMALNAITHAAVRADIRHWAENKKLGFVETAIFNESGLGEMVDEVWTVEAPEEVRISRVIARNGLSREEVISRIHSQSSPLVKGMPHHMLVNDDRTSLLEQILPLLSSARKRADEKSKTEV